MNRNKTLLSVKPNRKRWMAPTALALAAIMGVTTVITTPVYAANTTTVSTEADSDTSDSSSSSSSSKDSTVTKDETVYVVADAKGNKKTVTVSDQLKGAGEESTVQDSSTLSDIQNTKGDETYTGSGDSMSWKTDGEDIYYQGKSDAELPVGVNFTYYLDGEEIEPQDLVGKSGKLTIDIEYTNDTETTLTVDGKEQTTKVPFVMMTGMFMPSEKFSNITIDNGKIIDDGSKSIVIGFGMPGLSDILDVDRLKGEDDDELDLDNIKDKVDDTNIPESVEIKADVKDFEMDSTYTIAMNDVFNEVDFSDVNSLSDLSSKVDELEDATLQIVDGSKDLATGTNTLYKNYGTFDEGIATLQSGIKTYTDGVTTAANGANDLNTGAVSLRDGLGTISSNSAALDKGASDAADGVKSYVGGANQIKAGINANVSAIGGSPVQVAQAYLNTNGDSVKKLSEYSSLLENTTATQKVISDIIAAQKKGAAAQDGNVNDAGAKPAVVKRAASVANIATTDESAPNDVSAEESSQSNEISDVSSVTAETTYGDAPVDSVETVGNTFPDENASVSPQLSVQANNISSPVLMAANNAGQANNADAAMQSVIANIVATDYGLKDPTTISDMTTIILAGLQAYKSAASQGTDAANAAFAKAATSAVYTAAGFSDAGTAQATIQQVAIATALVGANSGLNTLTSNDSTLLSGVNTLSDSVKKYTDGVDTAYAGSQTLADGTASLNSGLQTIASNNYTLVSGINSLKTASGQIKNGIKKLLDGSNKLSDGTQEYYDTVITKGLKPLTKSIDKLQDIADGDYSYDNFSGIADGMDGTVRFVITTESIKEDDSN